MIPSAELLERSVAGFVAVVRDVEGPGRTLGGAVEVRWMIGRDDWGEEVPPCHRLPK